ncbi:UNVERIFIED_CONTAM: hypothetical protein RF648_19430 [Kocuria sp. CPCC 205274]
MASGQTEFVNKLKAITPNVYLKPTSKVQLKYPCITAVPSFADQTYADNRTYVAEQAYNVTVIENEGDGELATKLMFALPKARWQSEFTNDGLNHSVFTIYHRY